MIFSWHKIPQVIHVQLGTLLVDHVSLPGRFLYLYSLHPSWFDRTIWFTTEYEIQIGG